MPRRIWQWLKRFFQSLFGTSPQSSRRRQRNRNLSSSSTVRGVNLPETSPQPSPPRSGSQNTSSGSTGGSGGVNPTPTDTDYEVLFSQLLEGVNQGWSRGHIDGFLIGRRINKTEFVAWLRRFGERLLATPTQHQEIARRMVRLGEIYGEELGKVAAEIGRQLLALIPPPPPSLINNQDGRDNIWNGEVIEAVFRGNGLSTPAQRTAEIAESITEDVGETNALYNQGVVQFQAGNYDAALNYFDSALALDPYVPKVWEKRSSVLQKLGRYAEAIASNNAAASLYRGDQNPELPIIERNVEVSSEQEEVSEEIQEKALSEQGQLEAETQEVEVWFKQGNQQLHAGDFQSAVASYDKVLAIKPDDREVWNNRGLALDELGEFSEAIASFDKALAIKPDDDVAWYNRGNALDNLGKFSEAIASFDKALAIKPDKYEAWNNRGITLRNLGKFSEAIASFDKALAIKSDHDIAWNNRGNALDKLGRFEEAIASFDKALTIKPDDDVAWINRGIAAVKSSNYNPIAAEIMQMQFSKSPAVIPNPNLNQRGYEGRLLSYQEGLRHCLKETHPEGWGLLHQALGNAHYFRGQIDSHQSYWRKAVTSYNQALQTLTKDAFPSLYLEVLQDLIKALLGLGQTPEAKQLQREGTDLLRRLLNSPPWKGGLRVSDYRKKEFALKFASFQQLTVDIAVQSGQLIEALETAEAGKNACLTWLLYAYGQEISSPKYAEIQQLLNPKTAAVYWHISPSALTTFIIKHGEAVPIVLGKTESLNRQVKFEDWVKDWNQKYADYRQGKTPLNSPVDGGKQENSLPVAKGEMEGKDSNSLPAGEEGLGGVNWRDNLPEMLSKLSEILDIPAIELVISGITHLILIPHRDLHRLPLHALFSENYTITYLPSAQIGINLVGQSSRLSTEIGRQDAHLTEQIGRQDVRPTEQIGRQDVRPTEQIGRQDARPTEQIGRQDARHTEQLLSIEHPESTGLDTLLYAEIESSLISQIFGNPTRISGADVTRERLETELKKPYNIFHFNGQGNYNFHNPSLSALALSGDEKLTLKEIVQMSFSEYQLISLSACETAVTGNQNITTEYVGLVSGFLRQGASHVLSTLWTVNEIPAALFVIRFYQLFAAGATPPIALKHAQHWLSTLTYANLLVWYLQLATDKLQETDYGCWQNLRSFARNIQNDSDKMNSSQPPFNHPFYWAGFTITGNTQ